MAKAVRCEQRRHDCFANYNGSCDCLSDTNFKRKCPFYKSRMEYLSRKGK